MIVPHLIWEAVLLVVTLAVVIAAAAQTPIFEGDSAWWSIAYLGLLASGLALSVRAGTANLAVVGVFASAAVGYSWLITEGDLAPILAALLVFVMAIVFGAILGVIAGLTSVPAWAVSLAGLAAAQAFAFGVSEPGGGLPVPETLPAPLDSPWVWFGAFVVISLAGGALLTIGPVRRLVGANRTATDPVRFEGARLSSALIGFTGSSALAALAGLAQVTFFRVSFAGATDMFLLFAALAAILIGGVSVFGGRGGIAGTVLGVVLIGVIIRWLDIESENAWFRWLLLAILIVLGLGLSRLIEAIPGFRPPAPVAAHPVSAHPVSAPPPTTLAPTTLPPAPPAAAYPSYAPQPAQAPPPAGPALPPPPPVEPPTVPQRPVDRD